ncbi:MAG: transcription termination/antitermination protein NusA [Candidatus Pacebacteria bacterium]|nr:transcription termination/antitermination protein NusA [Candidatus Paceibacterota bacterium]MBP9867015.1 transcription termination/antitermination protein NusA [Candidatus Paceibacterota bacterium]
MKALKIALEQLEQEKKISHEKVVDAVEKSLAAAYQKEYGKRGQIVRCNINFDTGETSFEQVKIVVDETTVRMPIEGEEEVFEPVMQEESTEGLLPRYNEERHILLSSAKLLKKNAELEEEIVFPLENQDDFGRIAAQTAKQVIVQKIREAERESIVGEFTDKENTIVSGIVQRIERGTVFIDLGRTTAILPFEEQVPGERLRPGERVRAYLFSIEEGFRGLSIRLSRTHPKFLIELFKNESAEIMQGIVDIVAVAREPGSRSKIAVKTNDERVDPIGACVGQRGVRVSAITDELSGEKIDVIEWSADSRRFIATALSPAKAVSIELHENEKKAIVTVSPEEQSLAIGKGGQNVRLAAKLTGWKIDIVSGGEMIAEADEEGVFTVESGITDESIDEQVEDVLTTLNVTEDTAPKNTEIENAVEEESTSETEEFPTNTPEEEKK